MVGIGAVGISIAGMNDVGNMNTNPDEGDPEGPGNGRPKTPAQKLDELMKLQERYERLSKQYDELVQLQEADPYTNYYTDELLEEIMRLRDQWKNYR